MEKLIYDIKEVAELLGVTDRTIRNYLRDGKLRAYKLNQRKNVFRLEDIKEFIDNLEEWTPGEKFRRKENQNERNAKL